MRPFVAPFFGGIRLGGLQLRPVEGFAVVHEAGASAGTCFRVLDAMEMLKLQLVGFHDFNSGSIASTRSGVNLDLFIFILESCMPRLVGFNARGSA